MSKGAPGRPQIRRVATPAAWSASLRRRRLAADLTQEQFADLAGVSRRMLSHYERDSVPKDDIRVAVETALALLEQGS